MYTKRKILASAILMVGMTMNAQEKKSEYVFLPHAFISLQGGAQYTLGEAKFKDLISPNVQLGIGYQFNPYFGARLNANAWQSKGGYNGYMDNNIPGNITYKYKYIAPSIEFMYNISNAIFGFNPNRTVSIIAFIGGGANIAFSNNEANNLYNKGYQMGYIWSGTKVHPVGRGGIDVDFRISDRFSIGIEGNANVISDHYNSKKANNADWYFNGLVGFKISLSKTYKKAETPTELVQTTEPATPIEEIKVTEPAKPEVKVTEKIRKDIFFKINSTKISDKENVKIAELAQLLNNNPDMKLDVKGYADAKTGTDDINNRLAKQRAENVVKILVNKYQIAKDRIEHSSEGTKVQPFLENDKNRVSICVTKK